MWLIVQVANTQRLKSLQLLSQGVVGRSRSQANMGKVDDIRRLFQETVDSLDN
ncbi:MAG: hypothetical protein KME05_21925 [Gloeocapsa sp. UFS-A4-WI-NPMV-4B04]|nr:hypothetical protein [Gloeocapsa sp. UFS-A4-WI-NPMV-4B04]